MIKTDCEIIILTECWLQKVANIPIIPGYHFYATKNNANQNDGVVLYIKDNIICNVSEPEFHDGSCLVCRIGQFTAVVAIYRSPSIKNTDRFISSLSDVFQSLSSFRDIVLTGDLNIDIKDNTKEPCKRDELLNMSALHGLLPTHLIPTRLDSLKCIDHLLLKSNRDSVTLVLQFHLTDHCPVLFCLYKSLDKDKTAPTVIKLNYEAISKEINSTDFTRIMFIANTNEATSELILQVRAIIAKHAKKATVKKQKVLKPWVTPGLLRCIRHRDNLHKKLRKNATNPNMKIVYTRYRNFLNNLLKKLKREHDQNEFQKAATNPKKTWNIIKSIIHTQKSTPPPRELLNLDPDPKASVDKINDFFANVGRTLANRIKTSVCTVAPSLSQDAPSNSFAIYPTDYSEIDNIILSLRSDCAVGWDGIPSRVLKLSRHALVPIITHLCNVAIANGVFPDDFKKALVHPIYKAGDRDSVNNYRPISILTSLSKILEKLLSKRLTNFLDKHHIISRNQFGFRKGKSTEDAVGGLVNEIARNLDCKNKCLAVFLDISKAFDTVSIPLLLNKMSRLGIRGLALDIFNSYLTNRKQLVKLCEHTSDEVSLEYGVPQGSILGPTLFQIYLNELCDLCLPNCQLYCYADDTAIFIHGSSWEEVKHTAESAMATIMTWLNRNLLTLNVDKSKYITFSLTSDGQPSTTFNIKSHKCPDPTISCPCPYLTRTDNIKYLGVCIDQYLKWSVHIDSLTTRMRKLIFVFKNLRSCANLKTLKLVYCTLGESLLRYCISVWGGSAKTKMLQLERAQRAVLKVMLKKPFRYPTISVYSDSKVLTVRQLFVLQTILRMHSSIPYEPKLTEKKRKSDRVCAISRHRSSAFGRLFPIIGPLLYNRANKMINIYGLNKYNLKTELTKWLLQFNYQTTEDLLQVQH